MATNQYLESYYDQYAPQPSPNRLRIVGSQYIYEPDKRLGATEEDDYYATQPHHHTSFDGHRSVGRSGRGPQGPPLDATAPRTDVKIINSKLYRLPESPERAAASQQPPQRAASNEHGFDARRRGIVASQYVWKDEIPPEKSPAPQHYLPPSSNPREKKLVGSKYVYVDDHARQDPPPQTNPPNLQTHGKPSRPLTRQEVQAKKQLDAQYPDASEIHEERIPNDAGNDPEDYEY